MDFNEYVGKNVVLSAMPALRIDGEVIRIIDMHKCDNCDGFCSEPWMQIKLETSDKDVDGKIALVDCNMITCIVEME